MTLIFQNGRENGGLFIMTMNLVLEGTLGGI